MTAYLLITGAIFLIVGLRALFRPVETVAFPYALGADDVDAKNFLRSGAGGVTIASAGVFIAAAFVESLAFSALLLAVVFMGGLLFGRIVSRVLDGKPGIIPRIAAAGEALGFAFGLYWLWQIAV
jgi:hypothetical protein